MDEMDMIDVRDRIGRAWIVGLALLWCGCTAQPPATPEFTPRPIDLAVVAAELRRADDWDAYRLGPAPDPTGLDAATAALIRLDNYEALRPAEGTDLVAFLRGEAWLLRRDYRRATDWFDRAARAPGEMQTPAKERAALARDLAAVSEYPVDLEDKSLDQALTTLKERCARMRQEAARWNQAPANWLIALEIEQAEIDWAQSVTAARAMRPDGTLLAGQAWAEVVRAHPDSDGRWRAMLAYATFLDGLAMDYLLTSPPPLSRFDGAEFLRLVDQARALYLELALQDGRPERPVATARLEALNALARETLRNVP